MFVFTLSLGSWSVFTLPVVQDVEFRVTRPQVCTTRLPTPQKTGCVNKCVTAHAHTFVKYTFLHRLIKAADGGSERRQVGFRRHRTPARAHTPSEERRLSDNLLDEWFVFFSEPTSVGATQTSVCSRVDRWPPLVFQACFKLPATCYVDTGS